MGVTSTEMVTALGATFKVEPEIGDVATKVFATAGAAKMKLRPSMPTIAAKRFKPLPHSLSIRLNDLTSLDLSTSPQMGLWLLIYERSYHSCLHININVLLVVTPLKLFRVFPMSR